MNANKSRMRVVMLENSNSMMNQVMKYLEIRNETIPKQKISNKNKVVYYLLDNSTIIGVIILDKINFTDFQNAANNDKVYSFGIKIENKYLSQFFISEVWNDFINIKGNFIYCLNLLKSSIKDSIEALNQLYNIYYQLNFENIDVIFGRKVEGKKKYLKIKDGIDYKLNKNTKSENQKGHINAYLRNYPNNNPSKKTQNLPQNSNGPAIPTTKSSYSNGPAIPRPKPSYSNRPAIPSIPFSNHNQSEFNETSPLLGEKTNSVLGKLKKFFR